MPVEAVLFDMFDTLMLIERNHEFYSPALMRMFKFLGSKGVDVAFEKFNNTYVDVRDGLYVKADLNWEEPHFNVRVAETLKRLGYDYDVSSPVVAAATNEFCEEFMKYVRIDIDAATMLKALYGKYRLGIISNFAIPECVFTLLKRSGIDGYFDLVIVSGAINKRKPSEDIFKSALKILDISSSKVVFVGDTIDADIEGPKAIGMKAVYIERREQAPSIKFQPDLIIKRLKELPLALKQF